METDFSRRLEIMQAAFSKDPQNESLRAELQNFFDALRVNGAESETPQARARAKAEASTLFRRFLNAHPPKREDPIFAVDLSAMCESLAFACDLLCGARGKRIYCTDTACVFAACRPRAMLWAALNLLSNAVLYAQGRYIFIGTSETERQTCLTVSSEGDFPASAFQDGIRRVGSGLHYAAETARLHGGNLLLFRQMRQSTVALSIARTDGAYPRCAEIDFTDWLSDSLSPVYTALCGICTSDS